MNRAAPPVAPPVMGFSGASPVRAMQAMNGGTNRIAATPYAPPQASAPGVPYFSGEMPARPSAAQFNPLNNAGLIGQLAPPKTMVTFDPGVFPAPSQTPFADARPPSNPNAPPVPTYSAPRPTQTMASVPSPVANTAALAPQLTTPRTPYLDAAPGPAPNAPPAPTYSAPTPTKPMNSVTSPVANVAALAPKLTTTTNTGGLRGVAARANPTTSQAPVQTYGTSAPSGSMMGGAKPAAPAVTSTSKAGGASAFGGLGGGTTQKTNPGFTGFNAAEPNRALKMMRGF